MRWTHGMRYVNTCYRNTMINLEFFLRCTCSDIKDLDITSIPKYTSMDNCLGSYSTESKNDILDKNIFGNSDIKFNRNPLFSNRF